MTQSATDGKISLEGVVTLRGHIEKRGEYSYRLTITPGGGKKRIRESFRGTEEDAEARLAEIITEVNTNRYLAQSKITLAEYVPEWIEGMNGQLRPNTVTFYENTMEYYILPEIGNMRLQEIKPRVLRTLFNKRPKLDKHIKGTLSACMSRAVEDEIIRDNPCFKVRLKTSSRGSKRLTADDIWDKEQASTFLDHCKDENYEIYFQLALRTGMRQGEIQALRWANVFPDSIYVCEAVKDRKSIIGPPKTKAGQRVIKIDKTLVSILEEHRIKQAEHKEKYKDVYEDQDLVCGNKYGRVAGTSTIRRAQERIANEAKIPYIPPRNLRHTHASLLLASGVSPKVVSDRLGHESIRITLDIYSFVIDKLKVEAVTTFEDVFD